MREGAGAGEPMDRPTGARMLRPRRKPTAKGRSLPARQAARNARPKQLPLLQGRKLRSRNRIKGRQTADAKDLHRRRIGRSARRRRLRLRSPNRGKRTANGRAHHPRQTGPSVGPRQLRRLPKRKAHRPNPRQSRQITGADKTAAKRRKRTDRNCYGRLRVAQSSVRRRVLKIWSRAALQRPAGACYPASAWSAR
jgi:hypothetical protein